MTLLHFLPGRLVELLVRDRHMDSAYECLVDRLGVVGREEEDAVVVFELA